MFEGEVETISERFQRIYGSSTQNMLTIPECVVSTEPKNTGISGLDVDEKGLDP